MEIKEKHYGRVGSANIEHIRASIISGHSGVYEAGGHAIRFLGDTDYNQTIFLQDLVSFLILKKNNVKSSKQNEAIGYYNHTKNTYDVPGAQLLCLFKALGESAVVAIFALFLLMFSLYVVYHYETNDTFFKFVCFFSILGLYASIDRTIKLLKIHRYSKIFLKEMLNS